MAVPRARAPRPDVDPGGADGPGTAATTVAPVPQLLLQLQSTAGNEAVGQLVRGAERQAAFNAALANQDWPTAAGALAGMSPDDQRAALAALNDDARAHLQAAAAPAPLPAVPDVAAMGDTDKLLKAWEYAQEHLAPDVRAQVAGLFTPESIAMMAAFGVAYIAAQLTPAGWVADGVALATLTISAIFVGRVVFDVTRDLGSYFVTALHATTDQELHTAGAALSHAIAEGGVALFVALLGKAIGGGKGGGRPYEGPPPEGYVEALTTDGVLVRMPAQAVAEMPPSALQGAAATYAVAMSPTPPGLESSGGGSGQPPVRGEEVWDEVSRELDLDPADLEPAPADAAQAAADARAAGLTGPQGQPGTADLATQPHSQAPEVREEYGVSGSDVQSAHVGPTSFLKDTPGYSRGGAETVLLDRATHTAFDKFWKDWAIGQRKAGRTQVSVSELYAVMLDAIDQIPGIAQRMKNALAWRLQLELFRDLGLRPTDAVGLPYPNVKPGP